MIYSRVMGTKKIGLTPYPGLCHPEIGASQQKNKKSVFLFGFVFDLHYLWSVNKEERIYYDDNDIKYS